ncbi:MAG: type I-C CRISPR-associated protein Cas5, partial [Leptospiraceae bacterium]|nr:type I-C CRISPR-associated protein Cas5 [Leptospiraceae bacterium]
VWGENACFSRPEMKVERVSYDVPTPSAARGILEAILWKPALRWTVQKITLLRPIQFESIRRNELGSKVPFRNITATMENGRGLLNSYIEDDRQQRAGLILKDVAYIIHASFEITERAGPADNPKKFRDMFLRRVERGQCHHFPCLGCREFPAYFSLPDGNETALGADANRDLGWMFYDFVFGEDDSARPHFFRARLTEGEVNIPPLHSDEVRG